MIVVKLPRKHAQDWREGSGSDFGGRVVAETARTITFELPDDDVEALAEHAAYWATAAPQFGVDRRPAATTCLRALHKKAPEPVDRWATRYGAHF